MALPSRAGGGRRPGEGGATSAIDRPMHVAQKWPRFWDNDMHENKGLKSSAVVIHEANYDFATGTYSSATTPLLKGVAEISSSATASPTGNSGLPWPTAPG